MIKFIGIYKYNLHPLHHNVYTYIHIYCFFQAVSQTRTNTHDSFNDETFGSSEITSQDRAEEERKRRGNITCLWDLMDYIAYSHIYIMLFVWGLLNKPMTYSQLPWASLSSQNNICYPSLQNLLT